MEKEPPEGCWIRGAWLGGGAGVKIYRRCYDGSDDVKCELLEFYFIVSFWELAPCGLEIWRVMAICCCNILDAHGPLVILFGGAVEWAEELVA